MFRCMSVTIQLNERGTLTLPKPLRKAIGLEKGGVVVAEATAEGILLRPSATFPIEIYTDERVAEFDAADKALARRLGSPRK